MNCKEEVDEFCDTLRRGLEMWDMYWSGWSKKNLVLLGFLLGWLVRAWLGRVT